MASIYLIRHGQASFGQENYDKLSNIGEQQATRLGESLLARHCHFDKIVLGSMFRHKQTAELCLDQAKVNVPPEQWQYDDGLNEYDHQNIIAAMGEQYSTAASTQAYILTQDNPKVFFETLFNQAIDRWISGEHDEDYVESWAAYANRIKSALENIVSQQGDTKHIAVFTSGGPISVIAQHLLGVPEQRIMQMNWTLLNAGVTKLVSTKSRLFVASLNEHTAFEGEFSHLMSYK